MSGGGRSLLVLAAVALAVTACGRREPPFLEANARTHLNQLAGVIGSRPAGTPANRRAREYLIDQLQAVDFDVRVQDVEASRPDIGRTARVANVIATRRGSLAPDEGAIAIVAHYDSRPESPGATDNGLGVAAVVEAARVLVSQPLRHTLLAIFPDAEEPGLMGAAGLMTDPAMSQVRAIVNLDSIGSGHPSVLFQATPGSDWALGAWSRRAPRPRGGSYAIEIYRRLPNDTDFTIFQSAGLAGLNFAAVGDGFSYHTPRDVPERVTSRVLVQTGVNLVGIVQALDEMELPARPVGLVAQDFSPATSGGVAERARTTATTYFSILERAGVAYSGAASRAIAVLAIVLAFIACFRLWRSTPDITTALVIWTSIWSFLGVAAVAAALLGMTWAVRAAREVYHPWYAHPMRLISLLVVTGAFTIWAMRRAAIVVPQRIRGGTHPSLVWIVTLPVWIGLTALIEWKASSAAFLWSVPLLAAGVLLSITGGRRVILLRLASVVLFLISAALWLPDGAVIISFAVAALGREPIVTPIVVFPALLLLVSHLVLPPLMAVISGRVRQLWHPGLTTGIWLLLLAITAGLVYAAPAYTHERSLRREARYVNDTISQQAFWEVGSNEPGLDLDVDRGAPRNWATVADAPKTSFPLRRLGGPFVFRTNALADSPAPATIRATLTPGAAGLQAEITVVPTEPGLTVVLVMPSKLIPSDPNLVGTVRAGRWTASYVAPPPEGVTFRATFVGATPDIFRDAALVVQAPGLPDGRDWQRLPAWLPQERTVWSAVSYWILPVGR